MTYVFEPIDLDRQHDYLERLRQCGRIASDYSFINLWGWGPEYDLQWAWDGPLVWLRQRRPVEALWAPVGDWVNADWPAILAEIRSLNLPLMRVPEALCDAWRQSGVPLSVDEARDQWDYLYDIRELTELKGNRFHKKKNLLRQFEKNYDFTYLEWGERMIELALEMQQEWCEWRDCEGNDTLASENAAIARILRDRERLSGLTGGALLVDGALAAYTVAERLPDKALVIHFEKGSPAHKGSYQAINQMFLARAPEDCIVVNREQDLGDEGLRKAKLSYNPVDFVKKYRVALR